MKRRKFLAALAAIPALALTVNLLPALEKKRSGIIGMKKLQGGVYCLTPGDMITMQLPDFGQGFTVEFTASRTIQVDEFYAMWDDPGGVYFRLGLNGKIYEAQSNVIL